MKKVGALLIIFLYSLTVFSQKKTNYYFDNYTVDDNKNYSTGFNGKSIHIINSNNSNYYLEILISKESKKAALYDFRKNIKIEFDLEVDFEFEIISDLNNLKPAKVIKNIDRIDYQKIYGNTIHDSEYKNAIHDIEYEKDSTSGKTIIHLTDYKDNNRKKIISEHYYFLGPNGKRDQNNTDFKKTFAKDYNLEFLPDENLEKVLCLHDGKINAEFEMIEPKKVDFNFEFIIDKKQL